MALIELQAHFYTDMTKQRLEPSNGIDGITTGMVEHRGTLIPSLAHGHTQVPIKNEQCHANIKRG